MKRVWAGMIIALSAAVSPRSMSQSTEPLQRFDDVRLVDDPMNDGDSFLVRVTDRVFRVRLYFVDAPECVTGWAGDVRRVREQMRYFGLQQEDQVVKYGLAARVFVEERLAKPFTVFTAFAAAPGLSAEPRVFAFVRTADGHDLGELLVENGLARRLGTGRMNPEQRPRDEVAAHLSDLEAAAMLRRAGIWAEADAERIVQLRAEQRHEDLELKSVRRRLARSVTPSFPVDLNTCDYRELLAVPGIGPVLARRIIETRPHKDVESLLNLPRIRRRHLEQWQPYITVR